MAGEFKIRTGLQLGNPDITKTVRFVTDSSSFTLDASGQDSLATVSATKNYGDSNYLSIENGGSVYSDVSLGNNLTVSNTIRTNSIQPISNYYTDLSINLNGFEFNSYSKIIKNGNSFISFDVNSDVGILGTYHGIQLDGPDVLILPSGGIAIGSYTNHDISIGGYLSTVNFGGTARYPFAFQGGSDPLAIPDVSYLNWKIDSCPGGSYTFSEGITESAGNVTFGGALSYGTSAVISDVSSGDDIFIIDTTFNPTQYPSFTQYALPWVRIPGAILFGNDKAPLTQAVNSFYIMSPSTGYGVDSLRSYFKSNLISETQTFTEWDLDYNGLDAQLRQYISGSGYTHFMDFEVNPLDFYVETSTTDPTKSGVQLLLTQNEFKIDIAGTNDLRISDGSVYINKIGSATTDYILFYNAANGAITYADSSLAGGGGSSYWTLDGSTLKPSDTTVNVHLNSIQMVDDPGVVTLIDMTITSSSTIGTENTYSFDVDGLSVLEIYSISDGSGSVSEKSAVFKGDYFYMGAPTTNGSWRFYVDGSSDLVFEKRVTGTWTEGGKFIADTPPPVSQYFTVNIDQANADYVDLDFPDAESRDGSTWTFLKGTTPIATINESSITGDVSVAFLRESPMDGDLIISDVSTKITINTTNVNKNYAVTFYSPGRYILQFDSIDTNNTGANLDTWLGGVQIEHEWTSLNPEDPSVAGKVGNSEWVINYDPNVYDSLMGYFPTSNGLYPPYGINDIQPSEVLDASGGKLTPDFYCGHDHSMPTVFYIDGPLNSPITYFRFNVFKLLYKAEVYNNDNKTLEFSCDYVYGPSGESPGYSWGYLWNESHSLVAAYKPSGLNIGYFSIPSSYNFGVSGVDTSLGGLISFYSRDVVFNEFDAYYNYSQWDGSDASVLVSTAQMAN